MSKNERKNLLKEVKNAEQDFEWYPTTNEIIEAMYWDIKEEDCRTGEDKEKFYSHSSISSILDIGAGDCKLFNTLNDISESLRTEKDDWSREENKRLSIGKYMTIEKSNMLINQMPSKAFLVGTDFHENTLIDKKTEMVFCNPPYSEYAQWSERIIREANAQVIYLVIPQRWGNNRAIADALKVRKAKVSIVGNFNFLNAEDRKARAKVSLVKVYLKSKKYRSYRSSEMQIDPFDLWFNETFKIDAVKDEWTYTKYESREDKRKALKNELVSGIDLVARSVELYNAELEKLIFNYKKVAEIDADILKELNVNVKSVLEAFKEKIQNLKTIYWSQIFDNLTEITSRLTKSSRTSLLSTLGDNTYIDFTAGNIRGVVIWVIKNANKYFDSQMLEVYHNFTSQESVSLYSSNKHWTADTWRYNHIIKEANIKYALDYRIVLDSYSCSDGGFLGDRQMQHIQDIITIAKNLGFSIPEGVSRQIMLRQKEFIFLSAPVNRILKKGTKTFEGKIKNVFVHTNVPNDDGERTMIKNGVTYVFDKINEKNWTQYEMDDGTYRDACNVSIESDSFTTVRGFANGNVHFQFNIEFIKKLNLEVGRLKGWIKSPQDAAEEFDISVEEATEYWNSNFVFLPSNLPNLLPQDIKKEEIEEEETFECESCGNPLYSQDDECDLCVSNNITTIDAEPLVASPGDDLYDAKQKELFCNGTLF